MTLREELDARLRPGTVKAGDGGPVQAEVDVEDADRLGVSVRGVRVRGDAPGDLVDHAARIPGALHGALPERVEPVETDTRLGGTVLRTAPGEVRDREFYEVRSDGRAIELERWKARPDGRERIPFTLTRDQLGRVVDGLGEVVAPATDEEPGTPG